MLFAFRVIRKEARLCQNSLKKKMINPDMKNL